MQIWIATAAKGMSQRLNADVSRELITFGFGRIFPDSMRLRIYHNGIPGEQNLFGHPIAPQEMQCQLAITTDRIMRIINALPNCRMAPHMPIVLAKSMESRITLPRASNRAGRRSTPVIRSLPSQCGHHRPRYDSIWARRYCSSCA